MPIAKPEAVGVLDRASRCRSSQPVASGNSDFELRACFGLRVSHFGLHVGSWQTSNAPALQAGPCGSVTRRLHHFCCGENEIQVSLISSTFVGATPTPATSFGPIGSATPRRGTAIKEAESRPATEQVPGALLVPPGRLSAWCRSNIPGLGPGDRRCKSCRTDHPQLLPQPRQTRHPSSKRADAGATPAGSATAQWDNSSPPGCYPGRCWCESSLSSHFPEGRQIQAGCTCLENRTGASRGGGSTRAFRQSPLLELPLGGPTQTPK